MDDGSWEALSSKCDCLCVGGAGVCHSLFPPLVPLKNHTCLNIRVAKAKHLLK